MTSFLIENSRVLDVHALALRTGLSVWVHNGRIAAVGADLVVPEGTATVDAKGMTLMPGLIDCHVHVVASSFNLGSVAKMPNVFVMLRSLPIMQGMLGRGFTSVRDAGGA
ncbi:MAG: amidohydrolase family protein, partial [Burkholderiaceae bacterium]|nr:amidohydrolase family protein [Burkholderiaceae bacterium]